MSITINVTQSTGGSFSAAGVTTDSINLTVGGGVGPPGAGNVALAAGDGILITSTANVATINCTVEGVPESVLENLSNVFNQNATSGDVLAYNGTAWASSSNYATLTYVDNAVANLVDAAPGALDTLNELAAAIGDDANFSATITTSLAGKAAANHTHTFQQITNGTATVTGNLTLNASTGSVILNGGTAGSGSLTLNCENNTHGVTIQGPPHSAAATYTLTLPTSDGAANQVLQTDGSGVLSWANQSAGGGGGGVTWSSEPAASNSTGNAGDIAYGSGYFYLHDGTQWRRVSMATFGGTTPTITITTQPQDLTLADGGSGNFTVAATVSDGSTPSYQWQNSDDSGVTWDTLTGSTGTTYSLSGVSTLDNGTQYRAIVSAAGASNVTSNVATLTVAETFDLLAENGDRLMAETGDSLDHDGVGGGGTSADLVISNITDANLIGANGDYELSYTAPTVNGKNYYRKGSGTNSGYPEYVVYSDGSQWVIARQDQISGTEPDYDPTNYFYSANNMQPSDPVTPPTTGWIGYNLTGTVTVTVNA